MFRIRKITNPYLGVNTRVMEKVKSIIREQFSALNEEKINEISEELVNPLKYKYQTFLFIAENFNESIRGFAKFHYMPDLKFCFLDFLAVTPGKISSGVGGSIYERLREEAEALNSIGIFYECLPDDPKLCEDLTILEQNKRRLAFYERYGARPIINTLYETPVKQSDDCPPYLVFDGLGLINTLPQRYTKVIIRAILTRKYGEYCPQDYIQKVVHSVKDNPVLLREPRYIKKDNLNLFKTQLPEKKKIFWTINNKHSLHHIRERGYVESPVRVSSIQKELEKTGYFRKGKIHEYPDKFILEVHDKKYVDYFKKVCKNLKPGKSVYPYVFPIRNNTKPPQELSVRAGYYCIDTFTPLNQNAYLAARWGVNCTLTAADEILQGTHSAYVLTRPPGHHAERFVFGGFCYFNNVAIAANYFSKYGKVAILDIDYHHGNGQQQIFYERNDVLTISIHGHPSFAYPYFSGFKEETGENEGLGYNFNYPLEETITGDKYREILNKAVNKIKKYKPDYLIIALGLDTAKGDPTGTWSSTIKDFERTGLIIGALKIPTLIVQEGGYRNQILGTNAKAFFRGFYSNQMDDKSK